MRRYRVFGGGCLAQRGDKPKPLAGEGLDHLLPRTIVSDGSSDRIDPGVECAVADDTPLPNGVEDFVLGDDPVGILDQKNQKRKGLGLEGNRP